MILAFAPDGIGEIAAGDDLATVVADAVALHEHGPLRPGDIVVVTSKVVSKAAGLRHRAATRDDVVAGESTATVARRGPVEIVRTRAGLTLAGAGVDNSNVAPGEVLTLPADADAIAEQLRQRLGEVAGGPIGVIVSDTAGRAWRLGQTDLAIGAAGVVVLDDYTGRQDPYGNELRVTARAVADELAGTADLVKEKVAGRPVAVIRGLTQLVGESGRSGAADLIRPVEQDMFARGTREAVLAAVLAATGQSAGYEALARLEGEALAAAVLQGAGRSESEAALIRAMLEFAEYEPA